LSSLPYCWPAAHSSTQAITVRFKDQKCSFAFVNEGFGSLFLYEAHLCETSFCPSYFARHSLYNFMSLAFSSEIWASASAFRDYGLAPHPAKSITQKAITNRNVRDMRVLLFF